MVERSRHTSGSRLPVDAHGARRSRGRRPLSLLRNGFRELLDDERRSIRKYHATVLELFASCPRERRVTGAGGDPLCLSCEGGVRARRSDWRMDVRASPEAFAQAPGFAVIQVATKVVNRTIRSPSEMRA